MRWDTEAKATQLESQLQAMRSDIVNLAEKYQGDSNSLLSLLRCLEFLHRKIREEFFEESLPNTRHALYDILKEMEEAGGWPYIERMRLEDLVRNLQQLNEQNGDRERLETESLES